MDEDVGLYSPPARTYVPKLLAGLEMQETEATYEQILHILEAGVMSATPEQQGAIQAYKYGYDFPSGSASDIKTYTIEAGDDQQAEEMEYAFVQEFTLSGAAGEALKMSAVWRGRQVQPTTFTDGLAIPDVEEILFGTGKLYIDDSGQAIGSTQKSGTLVAMELSATTGIVPFWTEGGLYFYGIKRTRPEITLDITFEHDGTAVAEKAKWRSQATRLIRLKWEGSNLGDSTPKSLTINLAGRWESFSVLDSQDGNDIVTGTFKARYSGPDALFCEIDVINGLASVP